MLIARCLFQGCGLAVGRFAMVWRRALRRIERTLAAVDHCGDQVFAVVDALGDGGHDVHADHDQHQVCEHLMQALKPLLAEKLLGGLRPAGNADRGDSDQQCQHHGSGGRVVAELPPRAPERARGDNAARSGDRGPKSPKRACCDPTKPQATRRPTKASAAYPLRISWDGFACRVEVCERC